jgi:hypothetical protein
VAKEIEEFVGRLVLWAIRTRYRTQIRIAAGAAIGAVLASAYFVAKRQPPEG